MKVQLPPTLRLTPRVRFQTARLYRESHPGPVASPRPAEDFRPLESDARTSQFRGTARQAARLDWGKVALFVLLLPFFGQSFHYMKDVPPLWAASKAFPVVVLPLAAILFYHKRTAFTRQMAFTFGWLVLVSSFMGVLAFKQNFAMGLTSQIKLLPLLSFFTFLGLLQWQKPTLRELTAALLISGILMMLFLMVLWWIAPQSWYDVKIDVGDAPLFSHDDRGNRIRMPMYFPIIAMFYWYRQSRMRRDPRWLILVGVVMAVLICIVRTRAMVIGSAATLAFAMLAATSPRNRVIALVVAGLLLIWMFQIPYVAAIFDTTSTGYGVREITASKSTAFLGDDWLRWTFGVGSLSPINPKGMAQFFSHYFFLADVTWLGIIFEFGFVGAALLLALPLRGAYYFRRLRRRFEHPMLAALQDYLIYVVFVSGLYSTLTLQPGEVAIILAIGVYCWQASSQFAARRARFA